MARLLASAHAERVAVVACTGEEATLAFTLNKQDGGQWQIAQVVAERTAEAGSLPTLPHVRNAPEEVVEAQLMAFQCGDVQWATRYMLFEKARGVARSAAKAAFERRCAAVSWGLAASEDPRAVRLWRRCRYHTCVHVIPYAVMAEHLVRHSPDRLPSEATVVLGQARDLDFGTQCAAQRTQHGGGGSRHQHAAGTTRPVVSGSDRRGGKCR